MTHFDFQPGDGTRYSIKVTDDPYGGLYVICNNSSLWRYFPIDEGNSESEIKFLIGKNNDWTRKAIKEYLDVWWPV